MIVYLKIIKHLMEELSIYFGLKMFQFIILHLIIINLFIEEELLVRELTHI